MKITDKEIRKMTSIVENYGGIYKEFEKIQKEIEKAKLIKDDLLIQLENTKKKEDDFYLELSSKYGDGKLNFNTYEFETDD